jgi:competence protein ComEC
VSGAKLVNFRPAAFAAVFLCLGIFLAVALLCYELPVWWLTLALPLVIVFRKGKRKQTALATLLLLASFWVGFGLAFCKMDGFRKTTVYPSGEYYVTGTVVAESETAYGRKIVLSDIKIDGKSEKGRLIAYLPLSFDKDVAQGNRVLLQGELATNEAISMQGEIAWYNFTDELRYTIQVNACAVIERPFSLFAFIRERIGLVLYAGMDETSAAVTMAILTGNDEGIESGLLENMRRGGIAHVFAVSGLHIGALFAFVLALVAKTPLNGLSKVARFVLVAAVLLFYGGVCGFSASVTRAITICLCFYAAKLIGLGKDFLDALGMAAIVTLMLNPLSLFEAGFGLSFAACLGIALLTRPIEKLCYQIVGDKRAKLPPTEQDMHPLDVGERIKRACVSFASVSLAAQIATAPLCLAYFGYVSCLSLLLNFLFVPLVGATFSLLLTLVCIAAMLPIAWSGVVLYVPAVAWSAVLILFQTVDFSAFCIEDVIVPVSGLICYFLALSFLSDKWSLSRPVRLGFALFCFLLSFSCLFIANVL